MRLLWQSFLHEPFHEHLFLFVAGENGIHERDAVVLGVQLCNFVPAGQQGHVDAAAVGDELEQLCFGLTEAVPGGCHGVQGKGGRSQSGRDL